MARVLRCDDVDYDAQTGTCAAPYFGAEETFGPQLSFADAHALGSAAVTLLVVAGVWRVLIRMGNRQDRD